MNKRKSLRTLTITLITLLVAFVGVFLVIGEARQGVLDMLKQNVNISFAYIEKSTVVIWAWRVIIFLVILSVYLGARWAFQRTTYRGSGDCPKCGRPLHRVHRTLFDKFVSTLLVVRVRRYYCSDPSCSWRGLLRRKQRHSEQ